MYLHLLSPILKFLIGSIGLLILGLIYLFFAVIGFLTNKRDMRKVDNNLSNAADQLLDLKSNVEGNVEWIRLFLYSIGTIVGLVILFYFFRWLMGERLRHRLPEGIQETREAIEDAKDKRTNFKKRRPKDPRAAVRYYYGKHLLWLQHKRVQLRPQDTTEEIRDRYHRVLIEEHKEKGEASLQLKHLYRKSRYQLAKQITSEEAEKAKQLYQEIKTSKVSGEE